MANVESGLALFSRLSSRPTLENLYPPIFPNNAPRPNEVVEISGDLSCGKTLLLTEIIAHTILPAKHIGGKNASAILMNTDHHFDLFRLIGVLKRQISNVEKIGEESRQTILKESLERLIILDIFSLEQLYVTFYKLESILSGNCNIALVCIDSIGSYYWLNRSFIENLYHIDTFLKKMLEQIHLVTKEYNVVVMYTRPSNFASKVSDKQFKKSSTINVNYKISLKKETNNDKMYIANIFCGNQESTKHYAISATGINWNC